MDRPLPLAVIWLVAFVSAGLAGQLPLTVKEISLMLRTGYSSSAVMKELSVRHFVDTVSANDEDSLHQSGAAADLLAALKLGTFSLPPEQTTAAQLKLANVARSRENERSRSDTLSRQQLGQAQQIGIKSSGRGGNVIRDLLKNELVSFQNGSVTSFDDERLGSKKLFALYFSAHWCGPCRKFTPDLVAYYNRIVPQHPEFEVVFVSCDKSASAMETYMRESNMPWPAVDFQKISSASAIRKYAGSGIPCLVVIDSAGQVLSDTYEGSTYVGPKKVLGDLDVMFARGTVAQGATNLLP